MYEQSALNKLHKLIAQKELKTTDPIYISWNYHGFNIMESCLCNFHLFPQKRCILHLNYCKKEVFLDYAKKTL